MAAAVKKALVDALFRRVLKGTSKENLERIARGEGYESIDEWTAKGAPGLTTGLRSDQKREAEEFRKLVVESDDPELKQLYQEEYLTPNRKRQQRAARRREKELGLDPVSAVEDLTPSERGELYNLQQAGEETLDLKKTGKAKANLDSFIERLTNDTVYKEYIRQGYVNPKTWAEAGLPPFPEELTRPRAMARTRLGTYRDQRYDQLSDTAKRKVFEEEERIRNLQQSNRIPPTPEQFRSAQEEARASVEDQIKRLQSPKYHSDISPKRPSTKEYTLTKQQQEEVAQLIKEQGEAGKLLPSDTQRKVSGARFSERYEPKTELERSWGRLVEDDPSEIGTGVDMYGNPIPSELPWSEGHDEVYQQKLRKMGYNDDSSLTPKEAMDLRQEVVEQIDEGTLHPSIDIYTRQTPSRSSDVRDQYGYNLEQIRELKRNLDPIEDADELVELRAREAIIKEKLNKLNLPLYVEEGIKIPTLAGSATAAHQAMRGRGLAHIDEGDPSITGMEPDLQTADLDIEQMANIQQRYGDPERVKRGIQPSIQEPPNITGEEAAFQGWGRQRGYGKRAAIDLEKGLKDPAENISYGAPSVRESVGEAGRPPSYDPKVVASLRRKATNLRKKRDSFRDEVEVFVKDIADDMPSPYTPPRGGEPSRIRELSRVDDYAEARELAWEELRETPKFKKYMQDKVKLQAEINEKTPGLMEFDPYTRPQRTIGRPRISISEPDIRTPVKPDMSKSNLDIAMERGQIDLRNPAMAERWAKEAPQREARQIAINVYQTQLQKAKRLKGQYEASKKAAKIQNDIADKFDAIDTGFTKKNKAGETVADVAAWKKAGSPKPVDPLDRDRRVLPKRKLVDSFKKGRKIVNRKRGGIIKKPKGWGAARYTKR